MNKYLNSEILAVVGASAMMGADYLGKHAEGAGAWVQALAIAGIVCLIAAFVSAFFPDRDDGE